MWLLITLLYILFSFDSPIKSVFLYWQWWDFSSAAGVNSLYVLAAGLALTRVLLAIGYLIGLHSESKQAVKSGIYQTIAILIASAVFYGS
jgi:hypothetical protein